eukprot:6380905-Prymnesium_polylepis.2
MTCDAAVRVSPAAPAPESVSPACKTNARHSGLSLKRLIASLRSLALASVTAATAVSPNFLRRRSRTSGTACLKRVKMTAFSPM